MGELAIRVEAQHGKYLDKNNDVTEYFDVVVAASPLEDLSSTRVEVVHKKLLIPGRKVVTVSANSKQSQLSEGPSDYVVGTGSHNGLLIINPINSANTLPAANRLVDAENGCEIATFIGNNLINGMLEDLDGIPDIRAPHLARMVLIAGNYAQRDIYG